MCIPTKASGHFVFNYFPACIFPLHPVVKRWNKKCYRLVPNLSLKRKHKQLFCLTVPAISVGIRRLNSLTFHFMFLTVANSFHGNDRFRAASSERGKMFFAFVLYSLHNARSCPITQATRRIGKHCLTGATDLSDSLRGQPAWSQGRCPGQTATALKASPARPCESANAAFLCTVTSELLIH